MKLVFEVNNLAFPIKLEQHDDGRFCVTYGNRRTDGLRSGQAAVELGFNIMNALRSAGLIDDDC